MTIKSCVTISLVPEVRGGPFVFWDDLSASCRQAAELGFDAVEIFAPGPEAVDAIQLRQQLDKYQLSLGAMGTGAGWVRHRLTFTNADPSIRKKAIEFVRSIIDLAGSFGAPAIIGSMQGRWDDRTDKPTALALLRDSLEELGQHAKTFGVPLLYEPLNRYETNLLCMIDESVSFVRTLSNVKLLADLFHMNIEETNIAAAIRAGTGHIGHIHFVDSNRRSAGLGHIDYAPIASALQEIGYAGYLSAEAFAYPNPLEAGLQTITTFRKYFPKG
jgi:sugar phosphate isomerase/epimerase